MEASQKIVRYIEDRDSWEQKIKEQSTVLVGGCFDIFHYGHLSFLKKVYEEGKMVIIALESDEFIRMRKLKEPFHTQVQRATILSHLDLVDLVICLPHFTENEEYYQLVRTIHPDIIACTKGDPNLMYKEEQAKEVRARVLIVDNCEGFSSSTIQHYAALSGD